MLTNRRRRFSIVSIACLGCVAFAAFVWNRSYVEGRIIRKNWPEFTPGEGWGPLNEDIANELRTNITLDRVFQLNEGQALHYVMGYSQTHPEAVTGWNWYVQFSKNHIVFIRCIAGSLRLSVHSIVRSYQEYADAQSVRFQPYGRSKSLQIWGFGIKQFDHRRIAPFMPEHGWETARRRYSSNDWRIKNADYRVSSVTLPIWLILGVFLIPPMRVLVIEPIRHHRRRCANRCIHCNYSLTALTEPRCPECGTTIPS